MERRRIQELEDQVKFAMKEANDYKKMFEGLQKQMLGCTQVDLESSLDHERQRYKSCMDERNQMHAEMAKMRTDKATLRTEMAKMRTEKAILRTEMETLYKENAKLRRNEQRAQRSVMQMPGAFSSLPSLGFPGSGSTSTDISINNGGK